jgi:hypothetical protein
VPKTAIYKNRDALASKNEVRFPEDHLSPSPARYAMCPKERDHPQLGILVAATADARHYCAALFRRENVRHREQPRD